MKPDTKKQAGWASLAVAALLLGGCQTQTVAGTSEIQSHRVGDLVVALANDTGDLVQGKNRFVLLFRSAGNNQPVDAGTVTLGSSMAMPGMAPMVAPVEVKPSGEIGKYTATGDFSMSGAWQFEVRWDGPAGQGSTSFNTNIR